MKVKHLLALTIVLAGLATLLAHASTPQEDIARYTDYINQKIRKRKKLFYLPIIIHYGAFVKQKILVKPKKFTKVYR